MLSHESKLPCLHPCCTNHSGGRLSAGLKLCVMFFLLLSFPMLFGCKLLYHMLNIVNIACKKRKVLHIFKNVCCTEDENPTQGMGWGLLLLFVCLFSSYLSLSPSPSLFLFYVIFWLQVTF